MMLDDADERVYGARDRCEQRSVGRREDQSRSGERHDGEDQRCKHGGTIVPKE
jgi:hypothetical protein